MTIGFKAYKETLEELLGLCKKLETFQLIRFPKLLLFSSFGSDRSIWKTEGNFSRNGAINVAKI
jgi:hypothetical protein